MMLIRLDAKRYASFALTMLAVTLLALGMAQSSNAALYDQELVGRGISCTFSPTANGQINYYRPVTATPTSTTVTVGAERAPANNPGNAAGTDPLCYNSAGALLPSQPYLNIGQAAGFGSSRLVLVIQMKGYPAASAPSGGQAAIDLSSSSVGRFELARMSGISGSTVTFQAPLKYTYTTGAQLVTVPEFSNVTLAASRVITPLAWDGSSGGVVAFLARHTVSMAAGASFSANGLGFRGGVKNGNGQTNCSALDGLEGGGKGEGIVDGYWGTAASQRMRGNRANGGGGGDCENAGGGGGGNGGLGGRGGDAYTPDFPEWPVGGMGGQRLAYSPVSRAVLGGGGGGGEQNNGNAGDGGAGGGVVFMRGNTLTGSGTLTANGATGGASTNTGPSDGAGGGGGGGVIHARFVGAASCVGANALGGNGGAEQSTGNNHGPGGAGGGGRIIFQGASGTCAKDSRAGVRGTTLNGSTRGAGPVTQTEVSSTGSTDAPATGLSAPTATVAVPSAAQTVAITSTFSGTATALSRVDVWIGQGAGTPTLRGSTMADAGGNWLYTTTALPGGAHTMYVVPELSEIAGSATAARSFTVDATPPAAPSITTPGGSLITNDSTPTISGSSEPNATLHFFDGGPGNQLAGSATADGSGAWSFTLPALTAGAHSITARATDIYGNPVAPVVGNFSAARVITFDPVPAVLTVSSPAQNAFLNTKTPAFVFSSDKPGSATCQIDAGALNPCSSGWTIPAAPVISEGAHTVTIRWTDPATNVTTSVRNFTIDTATANINIFAPATNGAMLNSARPPISFNVTDVNAALLSECRVDGGSWAQCDSPYTPPSLSNGSHTVEIRHTDKANNVSTAARTIVVDTALPTVAISAPANGGYSGPSSTMTFSVGDTNPGTSRCQVDGGAEWVCTSGSSIPALGDGNHTLAIRHTDAAGNNGPSTSVSFTVDTIAPTVTIDWPPEAELLNTTTPQVLFSIGDANPAPNSLCQLDGGTAAPCTSPWVPSTPLSQGAHVLIVSHVDLAGNVGAAAPRNFTIDSVVPAAPTFTSGPGGVDRLTNLQTASIAYTLAEAGGTVECQLDDTGWSSSCASPKNFNAGDLSVLGEHSFFVRQIDAAGNVGSIGTYTWTIDQTPPPAPNVSGPSGVSSAPSETFTFYNAEQGVTFECRLDSGSWGTCLDTYVTGTLTDGSHSFSVRSTDAAGNVSAATTLAWETDTSGFNVAITSAPRALSNLPSSSFLFSATVHDATFTCELDGVTSPCSSPFNYGPLANGDHTFRVNAHQGAETRQSSIYTWAIDATPPTLSISSPVDGGTSGGTATLVFSAGDTGSNGSNGSVTTTCKLDSEVQTACSSGHQFENLNSGPHSLVVMTTDNAGNQTVEVVDWTVDLAPPTTTLVATPSNAATSNPTRHFAFTADKASTFECALDGASWTPCSTPQDITVAEGIHTFKVRATANGITEPAPATHTWTYDVTAPSPPVIAGDSTVYSADQVTFRGTAQLATSVDVYLTCTTLATCSSHSAATPVASGPVAVNGNWDGIFDGVPDGTYTVCARASDAAGNTSGCSSPVTLVIDRTAPIVAISSPTNGALVKVSTLAFTGSDAASAVSFECEIEDLTTGDPAAFELCAPPDFAPDLVSGHQYRITVRASDEIGNSADASVTFTFDNIAPATPTIASPATDRSINDAPVVISGTAESAATVRVYVNGVLRPTTTTAAAGTYSYTFSPDLAPGSYAIHVTATDAFGNVSSQSATRNLIVDRTAPVKPTITAPANGTGVNISRPAITGTGEANSTLNLTIDGASTPISLTVNGSNSWSYTPSTDLANGPHTLSAVSVDAAGNQSPVSDTTNFVVDNQPPVAAISSPANASYVTNTAVTINFTATDNDAFVLVCRLNGSVVTPCSGSSYSFTATQGAQTFQIQATDQGGNVSTAQTSFTVDSIAPAQPVIQTPAPGAFVTGSQAWVAGTAEPNSKVRIVLSSGQDVEADVNANGDWARTFSGLANGPYTATVSAKDAAGNVGSSANRSFLVDNDPPAALTIATPVHNSEVKQIATISGTGAEAGASIVVQIEGSPYPATVGAGGAWSVDLFPAYDTTGLAEISARQTDAAGNLGPATALSVRIDKTAPAVTITQPVQNSTINNPDPNVAFTATDASVSPLTRECRVSTAGNVSPWFHCTTGWSPSTDSITPLGEGLNSIQIRATDAAGNVTTVTRQFTVDVTPPATTINNPKPGGALGKTNNRTTTFHFSSEAGAQFKCSADGANFTSCTSPHTYSLPQFTDGTHNFSVKATDAAGNEGPVQSHSWTLDTAPPTKPVITQPVNNSTTIDDKPAISGVAELLTTVTIRVNGNVLDTVTTDGSANWAFAFPTSGTGLLGGLPDGTHTITATATDDVGNQSVPSDPITITIDANKPTVRITTMPDALSNNTNPSFSFTSDEPVKFECKIDSAAWNFCGDFGVFAVSGTEPFSLGQGEHTFSVRGADSGSNMSDPNEDENDPDRNVYTWTIDSVAPNAPAITSPTSGLVTTDTTPALAGTTEANSTVSIYLNGSPTAAATTSDTATGSWSSTLSTLADGTYNVRASATDGAGNTSPLSTNVQLTVDTTAPVGTAVQQAGSGANGAKPIFIISSDDTNATMTCSIDGGASENCFSPYTPSQALAAGPHTLTVVFRDAVGNTSQHAVAFTQTSAPVNPPTPPAPEDPVACFPKGVTITDLTAKGSKITLTGFAKSSFVGTTVNIQYRKSPKKPVGKTTVNPDGSFKVSFKAPAKKLWKSKKTAYRVQATDSAGTITTGWTQLTRRMASTSAVWQGGRIVVKGAVTKPLYPKTKALVEARVGCTGSWTQIGSAKISSSGKFSAKLKYDPTPTVVFVRVKAVVGSRPVKPRKIKTGSFVIPVVIK